MLVNLKQVMKKVNYMYELYSVNAIFELSYLQNQKVNLIQCNVFFKIV